MAGLERSLKDNFVAELQIEKQKHNDLLQSFREQSQNELDQLRARMNSSAGSRAELESVRRQLNEAKSQAELQEKQLREEIQSLKRIIDQLQTKLARLDTTDESSLLQLRSDLAQSQNQISETRSECESLRSQLDESQQQIRFLQDTVRRECEERHELTEALGAAREKILTLTRPPGGYSKGSVPASPAPAWGSNSTTPDTSEPRRYSLGGNKPVQSKTPSYATETHSASNVTVGFRGEANKPSGKLRGINLGDTKRRITAAMSRR